MNQYDPLPKNNYDPLLNKQGGFDLSSVFKKIESAASGDLGDILIAIGSGLNAFHKAKKKRKREDDELIMEEVDELDDIEDEEDDDDE